MRRNVGLVAGARGVVGRRLAEHLAALPEWQVIGLARDTQDLGPGIEAIDVDLTDRAAVRTRLRGLSEVTHVFYAARHDHAGEAPEPVEDNAGMLENLMDAIEPVAKGLCHVHLVHGTKYYGSHLGPFKTPARESDPRPLATVFYHVQADAIAHRQRGKGWTWSISHPHAICDPDIRIRRSVSRLIAVYAIISRELGLPLCFPGTPGCYEALFQCTDAALLARAISWMSTTPACANQMFNVINGDYFRWCHLWPKFASYFGMEPGPVRTVRLASVMADKGPVWERIAQKHGLRPLPFEELVPWSYGDFLFRPPYDIMSDMTKARRYGFHETVDSEAMFFRLFDHFRAERIIP
jgi:nucleoside-diphosphate-sugar epimerase